jgi:hypothetical protein
MDVGRIANGFGGGGDDLQVKVFVGVLCGLFAHVLNKARDAV